MATESTQVPFRPHSFRYSFSCVSVEKNYPKKVGVFSGRERRLLVSSHNPCQSPTLTRIEYGAKINTISETKNICVQITIFAQ